MRDFEESGAILKGHFILSSGLHSDTYLQCARVMMYPDRSERLCKALALKIPSGSCDIILSPAMGGVVVGYEMGRQLSVPAIFCERVDGKFALRRGFSLQKGQRVLVVEDVVTTGKSSNEAMDCARAYGAEIVGIACLIDRSGGNHGFDSPIYSLLELTVSSFDAENVPEHLKSIPAVKPGSRWLNAAS